MNSLLGKSWRTTLFGVGGLGTIAWNVACAYFDGNPATNVDWSVTGPALAISIGLLFARDHVVTSAQIEEKKEG